MTRKVIGTILVVAAGVLAIALLIGGRLIFPHIIGPLTLVIIGAILLAHRGKNDTPAK
jgi:hypothetical protein